MGVVSRVLLPQAAGEVIVGSAVGPIRAVPSVTSIPTSPLPRGSDDIIGANQANGYPVHVPWPTKVRRARLRVAVQSGQLSVAAYAPNRARLVTSGAVMAGPVGAMELALPPTTVPAGPAALWVSASDGTVSVGVQATHAALIGGEAKTSAAHPLPATLSGLVEGVLGPSALLLPDDPTPLDTGAVYARTDLGVSVLGKNPSGGRLYGLNITNGHWVYSDNSGTSWTDTSISPSAGNPASGVIQIVFQGANWYAVTSTAKVYKNVIETYTGWTDVTPSGLPAGTTGRADSLAGNGSYLLYGNYNATTGSGAHVYRSGDSGTTWTEVLTIASAKHVHCCAFDPASLNHAFVTVGDAGFAGNGLYSCADITAGTPTWSYLSTNRYGIGMAFSAVANVPSRVVLEGDGAGQPHLMAYYQSLIGSGVAVGGSPTVLTDPLVWHDTTPAVGASWVGTARGLILTSEGNAFFISTGENGAVGTREGVWLARGPWLTTPTLLEDATGASPAWFYAKTFESGAYLINYRYRMLRPKFAGQ